MNRRNFIASLVAVPAGVIAAVKVAARPAPPNLDLDAIFAALYAVKRQDAEHIDMLVPGAAAKRQIENAFARFYKQRHGRV